MAERVYVDTIRQDASDNLGTVTLEFYHSDQETLAVRTINKQGTTVQDVELDFESALEFVLDLGLDLTSAFEASASVER
ncbi:hypothetical protein [Rhodosalinus sp. FB01]|uniref:hypothetical protein n=1 Tax=Rhodosalinus sp. FB01 TaxID=3239194 RepID=UPI00352653C2